MPREGFSRKRTKYREVQAFKARQFIICGVAAKPTCQRCLKAWPNASHFVEALLWGGFGRSSPFRFSQFIPMRKVFLHI